MSNFIIPMGSLPSITSLADLRTAQEGSMKMGNGIPFADYLNEALGNVVQTGETSSSTMLDLAFGATDDLHTGAIAGIKTSTAVSYATSLVSRAIASYNEIMRMQI